MTEDLASVCFVLGFATMDRACPRPSVVSCFLLSGFWLLRKREQFQDKGGPGCSRNTKEAELLEPREDQRGEGRSHGRRSSRPQQRNGFNTQLPWNIVEGLEQRNGRM